VIRKGEVAMRKMLCVLLVVASAAGVGAAGGVNPLGFGIGQSTRSEVESSLRKRTRTEDVGVNRYSGGRMLRADGDLGVEGLNHALFIFDTEDRLAGVILDMGKHRFDAIYQYLVSKYPMVEKRIPFVGDKRATFHEGNTSIEISAPHLGFGMEVTYLRDDLLQRFRAQTQVEAEAKKTAEQIQF
jgi:hypothetical protein